LVSGHTPGHTGLLWHGGNVTHSAAAQHERQTYLTSRCLLCWPATARVRLAGWRLAEFRIDYLMTDLNFFYADDSDLKVKYFGLSRVKFSDYAYAQAEEAEALLDATAFQICQRLSSDNGYGCR
jgi:hypothetical protein